MHHDDILQAALESVLAKEPLWVERWQKWVEVWELTGDERGEFMKQINKTVGMGRNARREANFKVMYPLMCVLSVHYPSPDCLPDKDHKHYAKYPGAIDPDGNRLSDPHPKAGELVFETDHMPMLSKRSSAALDQISEVCSRLSALSAEDFEEKKDGS